MVKFDNYYGFFIRGTSLTLPLVSGLDSNVILAPTQGERFSPKPCTYWTETSVSTKNNAGVRVLTSSITEIP